VGDRSRGRFFRLGQAGYAQVPKKNRAQAALLLGKPDEALDFFLEIRPSLKSKSLEYARVEEFKGDAYFKMNLWQEACDSYSSAISIPVFKRSRLNNHNLAQAITAL